MNYLEGPLSTFVIGGVHIGAKALLDPEEVIFLFKLVIPAFTGFEEGRGSAPCDFDPKPLNIFCGFTMRIMVPIAFEHC
jgi:hypothetical protein